MATGKLYNGNKESLVGDVNYQFQYDSPQKWWGELTLVDYVRISDGSGFVLELEDGRKGRCSLKKRVNRAVSGVPPRYIYRFAGTSPLESVKPESE